MSRRLLPRSKLSALLDDDGEPGLVVRPRRNVLDFPDREHRGRVEHLQPDGGNSQCDKIFTRTKAQRMGS